MVFRLRFLQISGKAVPLHRVFHSIRFKVNKGWSTAVLLFLCPYVKLAGVVKVGKIWFILEYPFSIIGYIMFLQ